MPHHLCLPVVCHPHPLRDGPRGPITNPVQRGMEEPTEDPLLEEIIGLDTPLGGMIRGVGNQLWMAGPVGAGQIEHLAKTMVETTHPEV